MQRYSRKKPSGKRNRHKERTLRHTRHCPKTHANKHQCVKRDAHFWNRGRVCQQPARKGISRRAVGGLSRSSKKLHSWLKLNQITVIAGVPQQLSWLEILPMTWNYWTGLRLSSYPFYDDHHLVATLAQVCVREGCTIIHISILKLIEVTKGGRWQGWAVRKGCRLNWAKQY